jgi:hypothetical protein
MAARGVEKRYRRVGGVILTNADAGWRVATAVMRRMLEVIYDG